MNAITIGIFGYILLQLLIGFIIVRQIRTEEDYLVAGRRLSPPLLLFSLFATWFGAETCIGSAGAVYAEGLSGAHADPFGYTICLFLIGLIAVRLWKAKLFTLADFFRNRFSFFSERFVAVVVAFSSLIWAAAQIRAFGNVLSASSDWSIETAIAIATCVVILYTVLGGLLADAITDLIQGGMLILGLIALFISVASNTPDFPAIIAKIPPERFDLWHGETFLQSLERWSIPILGSLLSQELIARIAGAQSAEIARKASFQAAILYLFVGAIPVFFGLIGPSILPRLEEPEQLLPMLAQHYLHTAAYVIFAGALVSAILSTVDSALLSAASLISHNILVSLKPTLTEKQKLLWARAFVVFFGLFAFYLAISSDNIYHLVEQASAFGGGSILVVFFFGFFTPLGQKFSGEFTLIGGTILWILLDFVLKFPYSFLTSILLSFFLYLMSLGIERYRNISHSTISNEEGRRS